jgi:glycosyltransferase involved in cell wall biosynthesis
MKDKPAISVVLPSYRHGKYVDECLRAFLAQTLQDFELIVIDDASPDDNVARIRQYPDSRITLVARKENRGVAAGMNEGVVMAKADLVCFFATDDVPDVGYLAAAKEAMEHAPSAVAAYFPLREIDERGGLQKAAGSLPRGVGRLGILRRSFMGGNQLPSPGMVVRREVVLGMLLPEGVAQYSDWILNNRLLMRGEIVLGEAPVLSYRVSSSSLSSRSDKAIAREAAELRMLMDDFLEIGTISRLIELFGDDAVEFVDLPDAHFPYAIGRMALRSGHQEKRRWGYEIIMRHISRPGMAESLAATTGFTYKDFMDLAPDFHGSPVKEINDLRRRLRRQKAVAAICAGLLAAALWLLSR